MKRFILLMLTLTLLLSAVSCNKSAPPPSCVEVLSAMCRQADLPSGQIYSTNSASPDGALTEQLMQVLFGDAALGYFRIREDGTAAVDDCALFLPFSESAVEFAVFRCTESTLCNSVSKLCLTRLNTLRKSKNSEQNRDHLDSAGVYIIDNYVILAVSQDAKSAVRAARSEIESRP